MSLQVLARDEVCGHDPAPVLDRRLGVLARDSASGEGRTYAAARAGLAVATGTVLCEQRLAASRVTRDDRTGRSRSSLVLP